MKKLRTLRSRFVLTLLCAVSGIVAYAQPVVSTYDMKVSKHPDYWMDGPIPAIAFGLLFIIGIYLIYHYWANGKLRDDMS